MSNSVDNRHNGPMKVIYSSFPSVSKIQSTVELDQDGTWFISVDFPPPKFEDSVLSVDLDTNNTLQRTRLEEKEQWCAETLLALGNNCYSLAKGFQDGLLCEDPKFGQKKHCTVGTVRGIKCQMIQTFLGVYMTSFRANLFFAMDAFGTRLFGYYKLRCFLPSDQFRMTAYVLDNTEPQNLVCRLYQRETVFKEHSAVLHLFFSGMPKIFEQAEDAMLKKLNEAGESGVITTEAFTAITGALLLQIEQFIQLCCGNLDKVVRFSSSSAVNFQPVINSKWFSKPYGVLNLSIISNALSMNAPGNEISQLLIEYDTYHSAYIASLESQKSISASFADVNDIFCSARHEEKNSRKRLQDRLAQHLPMEELEAVFYYMEDFSDSDVDSETSSVWFYRAEVLAWRSSSRKFLSALRAMLDRIEFALSDLKSEVEDLKFTMLEGHRIIGFTAIEPCLATFADAIAKTSLVHLKTYMDELDNNTSS